jgi:hypothetical protein
MKTFVGLMKKVRVQTHCICRAGFGEARPDFGDERGPQTARMIME